MGLRRDLSIVVLLSVPESLHQLWHVDEFLHGWTTRTFMAWADPCLETGALACHSAAVLSAYLPVLFLIVRLAQLYRQIEAY